MAARVEYDTLLVTGVTGSGKSSHILECPMHFGHLRPSNRTHGSSIRVNMNKQVKATILALDNCNFHVKECIAFTVIYLVIFSDI